MNDESPKVINLSGDPEFVLSCEERMPLYKCALLLHCLRANDHPLAPTCALVMLTGCTHEDAAAAIAELVDRMQAKGLPALYTNGGLTAGHSTPDPEERIN